jgi:purine-nucleoside phosphorylase
MAWPAFWSGSLATRPARRRSGRTAQGPPARRPASPGPAGTAARQPRGPRAGSDRAPRGVRRIRPAAAMAPPYDAPRVAPSRPSAARDWPQLAAQAAAALRQAGAAAVDVGMVLGSGLGTLADEIEVATSLTFDEVPGMVASTAPGHAGRIVVGRLAGRSVLALQGRLHLYEGYDAATCAFPVRVMHALGARSLLVTSACGGLVPHWSAGDLLLQLDLINASGAQALMGPHDGLGERFTVMFDAYDVEYLEVARAAARRLDLTLREGVYLAVAGPSFATRAELRAYQRWGADAIGMSTVHEVAMARHLGLRVMGLSAITDMALPDGSHHASGEEVLRAAAATRPSFRSLVLAVLPEL